MKKEYISPEAEVFVCRVNTMLMTSGNDLNELLSDDNFDIVPEDNWIPDEGENVFNAPEDEFEF